LLKISIENQIQQTEFTIDEIKKRKARIAELNLRLLEPLYHIKRIISLFWGGKKGVKNSNSIDR